MIDPGWSLATAAKNGANRQTDVRLVTMHFGFPMEKISSHRQT